MCVRMYKLRFLIKHILIFFHTLKYASVVY